MFAWVAVGWTLWGRIPGEGRQIYAGALFLLFVAEGCAVVIGGNRRFHLCLLPIVALGSLVVSMVIMTIISFMLFGFEGVQ